MKRVSPDLIVEKIYLELMVKGKRESYLPI